MEHIKRIKRELAYKGSILEFYKDTMVTPDGKVTYWDHIEHKGAAAVVPVLDDGRIVLVRQYRNSPDEETLEIPAGGLEADEPTELAAIRELEEETGYQAKTWKSLGYINTTPGICTEKLYLYLAKDLKFVGDHPDVGEILKCSEYKLKDVMQMINAGKINDAKTICTLFRAFMKV